MYESFLQGRPITKPLIYFWRGSTRPSIGDWNWGVKTVKYTVSRKKNKKFSRNISYRTLAILMKFGTPFPQ